MTLNPIKITAPAGDVDRLTAAVRAGADEVYMGLVGYGARRFAGNFTPDEFCRAMDMSHRAGVAVHLTLNTIMSDRELDEVYSDLVRLYTAGLDAVIVQDLGVARWVRERFADLPLHASTQMSIVSQEELERLEQCGFARAILARELSLDELERLRPQTTLELEVFVSGALCLACSGKCLLSAFIGGRSGNRGACAQPCRHLWHLTDSTESEVREGYFLSLKDQWQGHEELARLHEIGIDSVKIEGRMKSPAYVYEAVLHYRRMIDSIVPGQAGKPRMKLVVKGTSPEAGNNGIERLFNRGYAKGYFYEHEPGLVNSRFSSNYGVELGTVRNGSVYLSASVRNGDGIVYLDADLKKLDGHSVGWIDLLEDGPRGILRKVDSAESGQRVRFEHFPPEGAACVYKTFDYTLNRDLANELEQVRRYEPLTAYLTARVGHDAQLILRHSRCEIECRSRDILHEAQKRATSAEELRTSLDRFGQSPFYLAQCCIDSDANVFVPKSLLNSLRQEASSLLEEKLIASFRRAAPIGITMESIESDETYLKRRREQFSTDSCPGDRIRRFYAIVRTAAQYEVCRKFGVPNIHFSSPGVEFSQPVETSMAVEGIAPAASFRKAIMFARQGVPFAADWTFNIANVRAVRFLADEFESLGAIFLSPEMTEEAVYELVAAADRPHVLLGLPVYGYLEAMLTRLALFEAPVVRLANHEDRPIIVVRNRDWYHNRGDMTGSTVYNGIPLDIVNSVGRILKSGIELLRFEFTFETSAEVLAVLTRAAYPAAENRQYHSYGFGRGKF